MKQIPVPFQEPDNSTEIQGTRKEKGFGTLRLLRCPSALLEVAYGDPPKADTSQPLRVACTAIKMRVTRLANSSSSVMDP